MPGPETVTLSSLESSELKELKRLVDTSLTVDKKKAYTKEEIETIRSALDNFPDQAAAKLSKRLAFYAFSPLQGVIGPLREAVKSGIDVIQSHTIKDKKSTHASGELQAKNILRTLDNLLTNFETKLFPLLDQNQISKASLAQYIILNMSQIQTDIINLTKLFTTPEGFAVKALNTLLRPENGKNTSEKLRAITKNVEKNLKKSKKDTDKAAIKEELINQIMTHLETTKDDQDKTLLQNTKDIVGTDLHIVLSKLREKLNTFSFQQIDIEDDALESGTEAVTTSDFDITHLLTDLTQTSAALTKYLAESMGAEAFIPQIRHQSLVDVLLTLAEVVTKLPNDLAELVPFFNPEAPVLNLSIPLAGELKVKQATQGYQYKADGNVPVIGKFSIVLNLENNYSIYRDYIFKLLNYFITFPVDTFDPAAQALLEKNKARIDKLTPKITAEYEKTYDYLVEYVKKNTTNLQKEINILRTSSEENPHSKYSNKTAEAVNALQQKIAAFQEELVLKHKDRSHSKRAQEYLDAAINNLAIMQGTVTHIKSSFDDFITRGEKIFAKTTDSRVSQQDIKKHQEERIQRLRQIITGFEDENDPQLTAAKQALEKWTGIHQETLTTAQHHERIEDNELAEQPLTEEVQEEASIPDIEPPEAPEEVIVQPEAPVEENQDPIEKHCKSLQAEITGLETTLSTLNTQLEQKKESVKKNTLASERLKDEILSMGRTIQEKRTLLSESTIHQHKVGLQTEIDKLLTTEEILRDFWLKILNKSPDLKALKRSPAMKILRLTPDDLDKTFTKPEDEKTKAIQNMADTIIGMCSDLPKTQAEQSKPLEERRAEKAERENLLEWINTLPQPPVEQPRAEEVFPRGIPSIYGTAYVYRINEIREEEKKLAATEETLRLLNTANIDLQTQERQLNAAMDNTKQELEQLSQLAKFGSKIIETSKIEQQLQALNPSFFDEHFLHNINVMVRLDQELDDLSSQLMREANQETGHLTTRYEFARRKDELKAQKQEYIKKATDYFVGEVAGRCDELNNRTTSLLEDGFEDYDTVLDQLREFRSQINSWHSLVSDLIPSDPKILILEKIKLTQSNLHKYLGQHMYRLSVDEITAERIEKLREFKPYILNEEQSSYEEELGVLSTKLANANFKSKLETTLDTYREQRNKRHDVKDKLTSRDKKYREDTISDLKAAIKNYNFTPEGTDTLINRLEETDKKMVGHHLHSTLNEIMAEVLSKTQPGIPQTNQNLAEPATKLVSDIQKMKEFSTGWFKGEKLTTAEKDKVTKVAGELETLVKPLVSGKLKESDYNHMKKLFMTKLHSLDSVMNTPTKREKLKIVALNLIIGLVTAGLAILARAVWQKAVKKETFSTFFSKTAKQARAEKIEKAAEASFKKGEPEGGHGPGSQPA